MASNLFSKQIIMRSEDDDYEHIGHVHGTAFTMPGTGFREKELSFFIREGGDATGLKLYYEEYI